MGVKKENVLLEMTKMSRSVNKNSRICGFAEIECHFRYMIFPDLTGKKIEESEI